MQEYYGPRVEKKIGKYRRRNFNITNLMYILYWNQLQDLTKRNFGKLRYILA